MGTEGTVGRARGRGSGIQMWVRSDLPQDESEVQGGCGHTEAGGAGAAGKGTQGSQDRGTGTP